MPGRGSLKDARKPLADSHAPPFVLDRACAAPYTRAVERTRPASNWMILDKPQRRKRKMSLPEWFCWTRFGTEAGQRINEILDRKEQERVANNGMFFWGIGNALGPSMKELLRHAPDPEVLFSPMKSSPRAEDVAPPAVVAWTWAKALNGDSYSLPGCSLVTSGHDPLAPKGTHYALVCFSHSPISVLRNQDKIALTEVSNLLTGRPVAPSQTTAIVRRKAPPRLGGPVYEIAIRAKLVSPYLLTLREPVLLPHTDLLRDWEAAVRQAWGDRRLNPGRGETLRLFPFPEAG